MDITRTEPPLIQLQGACKSFFTEDVETRALEDIDLHIRDGEYVAFSGPSGCGKSTLLSLLGLLDVWDRGRHLFAGHDVSTLDRRERAHLRNRTIGFVFQAFNLIGDLTIAENVALPLGYRADVDKRATHERVLEALDKVKMTHRARHYPSQLSGGQQQRVAVARAVVGEPSLILADEPTGNLDSHNAEAVVELLESLHRGGATLCMVTHDPRTAARAQRQVRLLDGRLVARPASAPETVAMETY